MISDVHTCGEWRDGQRLERKSVIFIFYAINLFRAFFNPWSDCFFCPFRSLWHGFMNEKMKVFMSNIIYHDFLNKVLHKLACVISYLNISKLSNFSSNPIKPSKLLLYFPYNSISDLYIYKCNRRIIVVCIIYIKWLIQERKKRS